jgi:hypothetical protein
MEVGRFYYTTRSGKLLLALVSTVKLGFGSRWETSPYFFIFPHLKVFWNGALVFDERTGLSTAGHSPSPGEWLLLTPTRYSHREHSDTLRHSLRILINTVKDKIMLRPTVSRPVCLGVKHLPEAYNQIFISQTIAGLKMWGALSEQRTSLSFTTYNIFTFYILSCVIHSLT